MISELVGYVRGLVTVSNPEGKEVGRVNINNRGDLLLSQALPELTELVRLGNSYQVKCTTGVVAATALPTTTSGFSLNNNEPVTGKCYLIDSFGSSEQVIDATQTDVTGLFAMLNKSGDALAAVGSGAAETGIKSLSGRLNYGGMATAFRLATVADNGWFPHGTPGAQMAPVAAGANWKVNEANVRGMYLVRPGCAFNIVAIKAAAAAAAQQFYFIRWHEVQLNWQP